MLPYYRFSCMIVSLSLFLVLGPPGQAFDRVLHYDTFEEYDTRDGGFILPEGAERSRTKSRLFFTEREIEAPTRAGETRGLARYIPDPSGLSLVALFLEDDDDELGDGSLGANGSVSLWESILLDQGDRAGRGIVSWTGIPFQDNETGGTMFPETDSRIDAGPEGLNLVGFGGVTREFDSGEPIPGQDFSGEIIINREGAVLTESGVGYEANVPTFFVLDFDLESSTYDLIINGVLVENDLPFFDIQGETGKTLRELELISNARGLGSFVYDNLFQLDPDAAFTPIPFRTPVVADQAEFIPLFMEAFDDNEPGDFASSGLGDLFGSRFSVEGTLSTVEDESWQTPARGLLSAGSAYTPQLPPSAASHSMIRTSFSFTPTADSVLTFAAGDVSLAEFRAGGVLGVADAGGIAATEHEVFANLPHWVSVTVDTSSGLYFVKVYRATAPDNAQTEVIEVQGSLSVSEISSLQFSAQGGGVFVDEILTVAVNEAPEGDGENRYSAVIHHPDELRESATIVTPDPTKWSFQSQALGAGETFSLFPNDAIERSARLAWTLIPAEASDNAAVLTIRLADGTEQVITGLLPDGTVGIGQADGSLMSSGVAAPAGSRVNFVVVLDLTLGHYTLSVNEAEIAQASVPADAVLETAFITNPPNTTFANGGSVFIDELVVVRDHFGALFASNDFVAPITPDNLDLLFEEDFENNPARSELQVNEFDPRRSGLPIPTASTGFSDLAETDLLGTRLTVGAPSAEAAYIEDPDGGSLYSLFLGDRFAPADFSDFADAIPFNPISTMRTVPYSFVVPDLLQAPQRRYVTIRWSGRALQTDQTGLALFTDSIETTVPVPNSSVFVPAPAGTALVAFGEGGTLLAEINGDGFLEDTEIPYSANQTYRFVVHIDQQTGTYDLSVNETVIVDDAPVESGQSSLSLSSRVGWFTTLVNDGDGQLLQQSEVGGGFFVMDDIRIFESDEFTSVPSYQQF